MSKLYRPNMNCILRCGCLLPLILSSVIGCAKLDKSDQLTASSVQAESEALMTGEELYVEALRYENDLNGRKKDYKKVITLLHMAESRGSIEAASLLGVLYYEGSYSLDKDYEKAFYYTNRSATLGNVDGMNTLGSFYSKGIGTEVNKEAAFYWYKKAAELGDAHAQSNVGTYYLDGDGVKKDIKKAEFWLRKSAQQGLAIGKENYARLLCYKERTPVRDCDLNRDLHLDAPMSDVEP